MLNQITVHGRLTRDPELRYTPSNTAVTSFSVAVERDAKDSAGNRGVDFIDCVAWRNTAEFITKYFYKGDMILLTGRLQNRKWTDRNGASRVSAEVVVNSAYFGGAKAKPADTGPSVFEDLDDDGEFPL